MKSKVLIPSVAFLLLFIMGVYFLVNPSYEKSLKAKYYFETGDYKEALVLAKEAFSMDVYNRMASTVVAQSITSLKYVTYNNDAKRYMYIINKIALHDVISDADKAKIRTICNIMIDSYIKLAPSVVTDSDLVEDAASYYDNFEKLLEKVTR
ncbi:hypothetical protein [Sulfurimonas sp.]|uniref:hypothetical protein n=1 Tax=Sulfurimonas sp. TaxID=2022749 RepID=UPI002AB2FEB0|nr:hypothetical protein [Sulfurimonas sp.]